MAYHDTFALASHTRRFLWATIGVIVPPRHPPGPLPSSLFRLLDVGHAGCPLRDPSGHGVRRCDRLPSARPAHDWLETQAGLEGIFTVSAVLLLAVVLH